MQDLALLQSQLKSNYFINDNIKNLFVGTNFLEESVLHSVGNHIFYGALPCDLREFLSNYFELFKDSENFTITSTDIEESEFRTALYAYLKALNKVFFEYCFLHGLEFSNYKVTQELHVFTKFTNFIPTYEDSYNCFYFILSPLVDTLSLCLDPSNSSSFPLGRSLPLLIPGYPKCYVHTPENSCIIVVKVVGV